MRRHFGLPEARLGPAALAIGSFDGVHLGHRAVLDRLVAGARRDGLRSAFITFDPHPRCVLDPVHCPPQITTLDERLSSVRALGVEEAIVLSFTRELAGLEAADFMAGVLDAMELRRLVAGHDGTEGGAEGTLFTRVNAKPEARPCQATAAPAGRVMRPTGRPSASGRGSSGSGEWRGGR